MLIGRWIAAILILVSSQFMGASAMAAWRTDLGVFRIGMIEASAPTPAGRVALKSAFEQALGMPAEISIFRDWPQLIDAHASGRINYAVYSAAAYATTVEMCQCIEPIAAPLDADGASGVRSIVLARKGKAASLADLKGIVVSASAPDDLTGWLMPLALLKLDGTETYLLKGGSAGEALRSFRDGQADAIFGWERSTADEKQPPLGGTAADAPEVSSAVLWRSPLARFGPHAVRRSLDGEAKKLLSEFLTTLRDNNPQAYDLLSQGHGGGFVPARDADYATLRAVVRATAQRPSP